jgi:uncharacterized protein involved in oxidation of intracellular sulfur
MEILIVLNDAPYGSEKSYNGLRLANNLVKMEEDLKLTVFLFGDATACAKKGQKTPDGYYNVERMLKPLVRKGEVLLCGNCMDARGIEVSELMEGARRSTLDEVTMKTLSADKVLVF